MSLRSGLFPRTKSTPPRSSEKPKRTKIRSVSKKRANRLREYKLVRKEFMLDHGAVFAEIPGWWMGTCESCGERKNLEVHHVRGRAGNLLTNREHFLALCPACHKWVHDNPDAARRRGLLAQPGKWGAQ